MDVTIITPTTGRDSLFMLIESVKNQSVLSKDVKIQHLLLFDDKREGRYLWPDEATYQVPSIYELEEYSTDSYQINCLAVKGTTVHNQAPGSALRAVGLMAAQNSYVTFADDDVRWEDEHLKVMLDVLQQKQAHWGFCKRYIWKHMIDGRFELLGRDDFESVGEEAKTPYKMVDNNCMMFTRRYGTSAACLYRETKEYNDDRLMYDFLNKYAGQPAKTGVATINQICPERLNDFFADNCTKINSQDV